MKKKLKSLGQAFDLYKKETAQIDKPWPFPEYWVGDIVEFEVLHGREMGGTSDVRVGKIIAVYEDKHELVYDIRTLDGIETVAYSRFNGNWKKGEQLRRILKCAHCKGTGLVEPNTITLFSGGKTDHKTRHPRY